MGRKLSREGFVRLMAANFHAIAVPPIPNAICHYKTHTPLLFNVTCEDSKNVKTEMKFNYPRDNSDEEYHVTDASELFTTKFLYAYDYLNKGLTMVRENKNKPFYSVIKNDRILTMKIGDKEDPSYESNKHEIIDLTFEQDDHQNYILKSYIINGPQENHKFTLKEMKIMENCDPKQIKTWNN